MLVFIYHESLSIKRKESQRKSVWGILFGWFWFYFVVLRKKDLYFIILEEQVRKYLVRFKRLRP